MHLSRRLAALLAAGLALVAVVAVSGASAGGGATGVSGTPTVAPQLIDDSKLSASTTTESDGADVTPSTRTIAHWHGTALDPHNGVTYGFNMVGADPNNCSGSACDTTIQADITPLIVHADGLTFDGTTVVAPTLASPQFATNDYGSTPFATTGAPNLPRGAGGTLSQGDAGNQLQLEDATMRAQFNKTGTSSYHVRLHANVLPAVTINVPNNQVTLLQSGRGVVFASVSINWWSGQIKNLESSADPTHLPIYLSTTSCCISALTRPTAA